jgi:hypothetical protein
MESRMIRREMKERIQLSIIIPKCYTFAINKRTKELTREVVMMGIFQGLADIFTVTAKVQYID